MNAADEDVLELLRDDLYDFAGYRSARSEAVDGTIWLNANEAAYSSVTDVEGCLRRYPAPQPEPLRRALADLYGCAPERLLIGRGSDEAIDLLVRAFCRPKSDAVLVTPPVFGMYAVCARLQRAPLVEVPLCDRDENFAVDFDEVTRRARESAAKLVFLCSPGNPAGGALALDDLLALARALRGSALIVVDEAYVEFAQAPSLTAAATAEPSIVVLRTLSKAHALAAARVGCAIGDPKVIAALRRCQAPYPISEPSARSAIAALTPPALAATRARIAETCSERDRLASALARLPGVRQVYPSQTNFLLVRFNDIEATFAGLLAAGVVVRDMRGMPQLRDALRITIGTPRQNDAMLAVLRAAEVVV